MVVGALEEKIAEMGEGERRERERKEGREQGVRGIVRELMDKKGGSGETGGKRRVIQKGEGSRGEVGGDEKGGMGMDVDEEGGKGKNRK